MHRTVASQLYSENSNFSYTTCDEILERIKLLAGYGIDRLHAYIDSYNKYKNIKSELLKLGYCVNERREANILTIIWG